MRTVAEWLDAARRHGSLGAAALHWQAHERGEAPSVPLALMHGRLRVMRESAQAGLSPTLRSVSGMVGGQAALLAQSPFAGRFGLAGRAGIYALSIAEYNACMGKIVAAPTAGSCGILPGALLAAQEEDGFSDDELVMALFAAAAIGRAIALQATISGAEGGCQAECGTAAGMAAAALTQLYGGSPEAAAHACAFALMNTRSRGRAGGSTLRVPQRGRCVAGGERGSARAFGRGLPHPPGRDDSHHARCRRRHAFLAA